MKNSFHSCLPLLFLALSLLEVSAQQVAPGYTLSNWTTKEGLPVNSISDITITSDNYLWLQASSGMIRFDGAKFGLFNTQNTSAFKSLEFRTMTKAVGNEFWLDSGLDSTYRFIQYKNGTFTAQHFGKGNKRTGFLGTSKRYKLTSKAEFWVATPGGVYQFLDTGFIWMFEKEINSEVIGLSENNGTLAVATLSGFYLILGDNIEFIEADNTGILDFEIDSFGVIWTISYTKLRSISRASQKEYSVEAYAISNEDSYKVLSEDPSYPGRIIVNSSNLALIFYKGIFQEIKKSKPLLLPGFELPSDQENEYSGWVRILDKVFFESRLVADLESDINGSLVCSSQETCWTGTGKGLFKISKSLFTSYGQEQGVTNVYPLFEDSEGGIWTAGLEREVFRVKDANVDVIASDRITFHRGFAFLEDSDKNIWVGDGSGINIWNRNTGLVTKLQTPFSSQGIQVKVLRWISDKKILAGSRAGLWVYNLEDKSWKEIISEDGRQLQVEQFHLGPTGSTWIGTANSGLYLLKKDILVPFSENELLSGVTVRSLYEDSTGILWVGMNGGGVNRIDFSGSAPKITLYTRENGLFGSVIHNIIEDKFGRMWMSSNQGIFWYTKEQLTEYAQGRLARITPVVYQQEDGLPGDEANGGAQTSGLLVSDGTLWFAMLKGITSVNPADVDLSSTSFPTKIERVSFKDSIITEPTSSILLSKHQRDIELNFTAFNYSIPADNFFFTYKLEGLDNDWTIGNQERVAQYNNLSPGEYTFRVKAGIGNLWDDANESSIGFTIEPYFYETGIFKLLSGSTITLLLGGYLFWGIRRRKLLDEEYEIAVSDRANMKSEREHIMGLVNAYIEKEIKNPGLVISDISEEINLSERNLYRKIKEYTGLTPAKYILEFRLLKARELLEKRNRSTISEVAYETGFSYPGYFTKLFEKRFGIHPKEV